MNYKYFLILSLIATWISIQPFLNKFISQLGNDIISSTNLSIMTMVVRLLYDFHYIYKKGNSDATLQSTNWKYYFVFLIIIFGQTMIDGIVFSKFDDIALSSDNYITYIQSGTIVLTYIFSQFHKMKRYDVISIVAMVSAMFLIV